MGFTVRPDGSIEAETVDEAIALSRRITKHQEQPQGALFPVNGEKRAEAAVTKGWPSFLKLTEGTTQRAFLEALAAAPEGRTLEEMRDILKQDSTSQVAGIITALKKNAKKAAVDPDAIFDRTVHGPRSSRKITYKLSGALKPLLKT
jgi:hypothetical protein